MPTELPDRKKMQSDRVDVSTSALKWFVIVGALVLAVFLVQVASGTIWPQPDELSPDSTSAPVIP
jgi:hypothetical protein